MTLDLNTNDDDILNFFKVKKVLFSVLPRDVLLDIMRELVDNAKYVDFISSRSRNIINPHRPTLNLTFKLQQALDDGIKYITINKNLNKTSEVINERTKIIRNEVVNPFMEILADFMLYIMDRREVKYMDKVNLLIGTSNPDDIKNELKAITTDEETMKEYFSVSTMSSIRFAEYDKANIDEDTDIVLEFAL